MLSLGGVYRCRKYWLGLCHQFLMQYQLMTASVTLCQLTSWTITSALALTLTSLWSSMNHEVMASFAYTPWSIQNGATLFTLHFSSNLCLCAFYTIENRNKYCTNELQNLQLCHDYLIRPKTTWNSTFLSQSS